MTDLLSEDELAGLKALVEGAWNRSAPGHWLLSESDHLKADLCQAFAAHIDALNAERDGLREEIDELEQAKTAEDVWPKWAMSVHKLLTERGVYLGDEDECHLPDDLAEYIREFEKACEEIQHPLLAVTKDGTLDLSATIATARTSALKEAAGVAKAFAMRWADKPEPVCESACSAGNEIAAAILSLLQEEDGWMPIESAPKDGTRVLLWSQMSEDIYSGYWSSNLPSTLPEIEGYWLERPYAEYDREGYPYRPIHEVTHWRPLPAPPSSQLQR